jgi:hypothetical protein
MALVRYWSRCSLHGAVQPPVPPTAFSVARALNSSRASQTRHLQRTHLFDTQRTLHATASSRGLRLIASVRPQLSASITSSSHQAIRFIKERVGRNICLGIFAFMYMYIYIYSNRAKSLCKKHEAASVDYSQPPSSLRQGSNVARSRWKDKLQEAKLV